MDKEDSVVIRADSKEEKVADSKTVLVVVNLVEEKKMTRLDEDGKKKEEGVGEEGGSGDISGVGGDETQPQQPRRGRTPLPEQTQAARSAPRG